MACTFNILLLAFLFSFAAADGNYECEEDSDCRKYHYCDYSYEGIGISVSSQCISNIDATFGPACNGDNTVCQENDTGREDASPAICFEHEGKYACRSSYFMPCKDMSECAAAFECESRTFKDGEASVCVPREWYSGGGNRCQTSHDCGYSTYFGHRWMPCRRGVCAKIVA